MSFTRRTEIRHISPADLGKIAQLLNQTFAWKKLMQTVPSELTHPEHLNEGKQKYNFNHMKLVENASFKLNKAPAEIFLEEWVTTGKIRPTLSHLLQLLIKSELFRAADYVAVTLLNEEPPQRPSKGPAAKIDIALPDDDETDDVVERILKMNYPNTSEIINLNNGHITSKEVHNKQIFEGTSTADAPISEVDLIRFSTVRSISNNVQIQENNHTGLQAQELTSGFDRATQRPEYSDIQVSLTPSSIHLPNMSCIGLNLTPTTLESSHAINTLVSLTPSSIELPNISCIGLNLSPTTLESSKDINESTDYVTSTGSTSTSYNEINPISLLNANYSHQPVQQVQDPPIISSSVNIFPNVSLLNLEPNDASKSNLHDYVDDSVELPNLSVLNLSRPIDTHHQELELAKTTPQFSALIHVSADSSENVAPRK